MLLEIVRAVRPLHALGVTQGDVSLGNILVISKDEIRLADFGTVTAHAYLTEE